MVYIVNGPVSDDVMTLDGVEILDYTPGVRIELKLDPEYANLFHACVSGLHVNGNEYGAALPTQNEPDVEEVGKSHLKALIGSLVYKSAAIAESSLISLRRRRDQLNRELVTVGNEIESMFGGSLDIDACINSAADYNGFTTSIGDVVIKIHSEKDLVVQGKLIGDLEIEVNLTKLASLRSAPDATRAISVKGSMNVAGFYAPHVTSSGVVCLGNLSGQVTISLKTYDFDTVAHDVLECIKNPNMADAWGACLLEFPDA